LWNLKLLQFKINYWTVEITCRIAVLIKYLSNQRTVALIVSCWILRQCSIGRHKRNEDWGM
jgi:hypothetical protein